MNLHSATRVRAGEDEVTFLAPCTGWEARRVLERIGANLEHEQHGSGKLFVAFGLVGLVQATRSLLVYFRDRTQDAVTRRVWKLRSLTFVRIGKNRGVIEVVYVSSNKKFWGLGQSFVLYVSHRLVPFAARFP